MSDELTFLFRARYVIPDITSAWRTRRTLGYRHLGSCVKLAGSFVFGYSVRCFGNLTEARQRALKANPKTRCQNQTDWDPIIGAYCETCWKELDAQRKNRLHVVP